MKNSNYTIGNQTRDIPACSAVPQPTAPPRTPPPKKKFSVPNTNKIIFILPTTIYLFTSEHYWIAEDSKMCCLHYTLQYLFLYSFLKIYSNVYKSSKTLRKVSDFVCTKKNLMAVWPYVNERVRLSSYTYNTQWLATTMVNRNWRIIGWRIIEVSLYL